MNTLAHLAAMIALLWLAIYSFGTLGVDALGYVMLGLFLAFIPMTIMAVVDDWHILHGGKERHGEED